MNPLNLAVFTADTTMITDATTAIGTIVAAAILCYAAAFAWPVSKKVYRVAKSVLGIA